MRCKLQTSLQNKNKLSREKIFKMKYSFVVVVLAAYFSGSRAQMNATCNASDETPVMYFQEEKMLGWWFGMQMVRRLSEDVRPVSHRCLAHYITSGGEENPNIYRIEESFQNLTGDGVDHLFSTIIPDPETPGIWTIISDNNFDPETISVHVHTDYENWNVQYDCQVRNNYRLESMIIMTRSRTPSQEVIDVLETIVAGHGFPKENAVHIDQTNCSN